MEAKIAVLPPPPIQGIGNAGGFTMMVQLRDGSFDYTKLQASPSRSSATRSRRPDCSACRPRSVLDVPQLIVEVDRVKAQTLFVPVNAIFSNRYRAISARPTSRSSTSSAARSRSMCRPTRNIAVKQSDIDKLSVRSDNGDMVPLGTVAKITPSVGPSLITLYNLYPPPPIIGLPASGLLLGPALSLMEQIANRTLPPRIVPSNGRRCRIRRRPSAIRSTIVFALALLLVYLCPRRPV
jgi:HAE1 family hydrophobic/amphiphilic exporter-1